MRGGDLTLQPVTRFSFRTPLLPLAELTGWSEGLEGLADPAAVARDTERLRARLRAWLERSEVRDALFVASPDLEESLPVWMRDPDSARGVKVERTLARYLARMASRPTPFGLFSGVSVGAVAGSTSVRLAPRTAYRRSTRLDNDYLFALTEAMTADPALRAELRWRPSSSLYQAAGRLRYAEARLRDRDRSYHLVAVDPSDYLLATLNRAADGATMESLARALVADDPEIELDEALAFVGELIDSQMLVSDLAPAVTGRQPVHGVLDQLGAHPAGQPAAEVLALAQRAIEAIDAGGLGAEPEAYRSVARTLEVLPPRVDLRRLFQVDMVKPAPEARLSSLVVDEVAAAVALLHRLSQPPAETALDHFIDEFGRRYETREVPLVEALDEESGIGFQSSRAPAAEASPLLADLPFSGRRAPPQTPWDRREAHLLRLLHDTWRRGGTELRLSRADLDLLAADDPAPLPDAFSAVVELAARSADDLDRGRFRVLIGTGGGPSGARILGRFCHASAAVEDLVRDHLRAEEALDPDAVFAEIVHLPEGRIGNILCRPVLRDHEIPYLGTSEAPRERQIPVQDLLVSVQNGRIVLRSRRLGCRVEPRMTTAHNYGLRSQGIYRFLCALQTQQTAGFGWSWGALGDAPFLPRVTHGRLVLTRARWRLDASDLAPVAKAFAGAKKAVTGPALAELRGRVFAAVSELRRRVGLPRWVVLADGDNELPVDLDNVLAVDSFAQLVKSRSMIELLELYPGPDDLVAEADEGAFAAELVFAFVRDREPTREPARPAAPAPLVRRLTIDSGWLYAKLYTGTATADDLLRDVIAPLNRSIIDSGAADAWFFLRYGDPDFHLRVRYRGDPERLRGELLPALHQAVRPLIDDRRVWKLTLDTYEREVERYGGPEGMEPSEAVFHADSDAVLGIVELLSGDEGMDARWRLCVRGAHLLLDDFELPLEQRLDLMTRLRDSFAREFAADTQFHKQVGARFRRERDAILALVEPDAACDAASDLAPGFELLAARSVRQRQLAADLRRRSLTLGMPELVASYIHMHLNRLLRSAQRAHELVIYDLLRRAYESRRARSSR